MIVACGAGAGDLVDPTASVRRGERVWIDTSRETPVTAMFSGAPERTLRTLIWQSDAKGPLPLIVLAHGLGGLPEKFDALGRALAVAGVVVAAPAFPLTNEQAPGGHEAGLGDVVNQPADTSFVISRLLEANRTPGDPLNSRIVSGHIAVLGHSLGGVTVVALTRKNCCRDDRVRASIIAAAPWGLAIVFGNDPIAASGPPTLIIHGTADPAVAYESSPQLYDMILPPRFLVGIAGAGHSEGLESQVEPPVPARDATQRAAIGFLRAVFEGADGVFQATLAALEAEGHVVQADAE